MNTRYPALSIISITIAIVGILVLISGLYYFFWRGIIEPELLCYEFTPQTFIELISGAFGIIISIILLAISELIVDIEENTRNSSYNQDVAVSNCY